MPKVTFYPEGKSIQVRKGETVLAAAAKARVFISHKCGGNASCTTCRIKVLTPSAFTTPNLREKRRLTEEQINHHIRLSCQVLILEDGKVEKTPLSIINANRNLDKGEEV